MTSMSRKDRRTRQADAAGSDTLSGLVLPEPFTGATVQKTFRITDVPTAQELADVLEAWGVTTKDWGSGNTKEVSKFWKEIKENEAGLEVWQIKGNKSMPVRVTHVLRAKVTSADAHARRVYLFNTWQQYGDGRKRIRNGLLSEKLTLDEMPLVAHLHDVCQRAVTEEEMQRVVDSAVRIGPHRSAPEYDSSYVCPLTVVGEEFVDHTVEIEASKSYPGLMTVYHLYTVDIICEGLPTVDFNTLEFEHPDKDGKRKLKYIHAWVWLEWGMIQRYLFDGSEMKERKSKGSFRSPEELETWLGQFDVDLDSWGRARKSLGGSNSTCWKSVEKLWKELESSQTQLERWGRNDGVPLLMRVVHVLQMKVTSGEAAHHQKFLFQVWHQSSNGQIRHVNRTMAKKLNTADLPFDAAKFEQAAKQEVKEQLSYLADVHIRLADQAPPTEGSLEKSGVNVTKVEFSDHRFDLEDSPSYKDMTTMYHLYTVEVQCTGLPTSDFASISFDANKNPSAIGWRWTTWQETLDILHQRAQLLERREASMSDKIRELSDACQVCLEELNAPKKPPTDQMSVVKKKLEDMSVILQSDDKKEYIPGFSRLPPSMVSTLADRKGVSDDFLDGALLARQLADRISTVRVSEDQDEDMRNLSTSPREVEQQRANGGKSGFCSLFCGSPSVDVMSEFRK